MSAAQADFLKTLDSLRKIADRLGAVPAGSGGSRSENQIVLNGLHVVSFAALEDFVRRRTLEVFTWMGDQNIPFDSFPTSLQILILQGTIEGVAFSLDRIEKRDRITLLQLQGLLLGGAGENEKFIPSEYFFGKSSSNISKGNINSLFEALGIDEKGTTLSTIADMLGMRHLGSIEEIFVRFAKNRHSAAHAFSDEYKLTDYKTDISAAMPFFAFAFDTAISQCAQLIKKTVIDENQIYSEFSVKKISIRVLEFDATERQWIEYRNQNKVATHTKGKVEGRINKFKTGELAKTDSILRKSMSGTIEEWVQPLR